jgi:hypothetical protein
MIAALIAHISPAETARLVVFLAFGAFGVVWDYVLPWMRGRGA